MTKRLDLKAHVDAAAKAIGGDLQGDAPQQRPGLSGWKRVVAGLALLISSGLTLQFFRTKSNLTAAEELRAQMAQAAEDARAARAARVMGRDDIDRKFTEIIHAQRVATAAPLEANASITVEINDPKNLKKLAELGIAGEVDFVAMMMMFGRVDQPQIVELTEEMKQKIKKATDVPLTDAQIARTVANSEVALSVLMVASGALEWDNKVSPEDFIVGLSVEYINGLSRAELEKLRGRPFTDEEYAGELSRMSGNSLQDLSHAVNNMPPEQRREYDKQQIDPMLVWLDFANQTGQLPPDWAWSQQQEQTQGRSR